MEGKKICTMISFLIGALLYLTVPQAFAADRLYFSPLVENPQGTAPRVILSWGALEGEIPDDITGFRLYRSENGGDHSLIEETVHGLQNAAVLHETVLADPNVTRRDMLISRLEAVRTARYPEMSPINPANFASFLHSLLDPSSELFNPLQRMLLYRSNPSVAQSAGLAFVDQGPFTPGTLYSYILTGIQAGGETLPLGQSADVNPQTVDILPAPTGLKQIYVGACSDFGKNLDDLQVHLAWDIPSGPSQIGLNILTYGYDLFWSEEELASLDLNQGIPAALHRVNETPVVVSGPPEPEGSGSYMAKDTKKSHLAGPEWKRGQSFFYYIAAVDISGRYSQTAGPHQFTVADGQPPPAPWRLHTEESASVVAGVSGPRISLVWDQINPLNYVRYFGADRSVCSSDSQQICTAPSADECSSPGKLYCVDMEVSHYLVFRFGSPLAASSWGQDSDGDYWPDDLEEASGTAPCDPDSRPGNVDPPVLVATVYQDESLKQRDLRFGQKQFVFTDQAIGPDQYETVFYYRVKAVDKTGNQGPFSPPIRAVLHDRRQPAVSATLENMQCEEFTVALDQSMTNYQSGDLLNIVDNSGKARSYYITKYCGKGNPGEIVGYGNIDGGVVHVTEESLRHPYGCTEAGCDGYSDYHVSFYDAANASMGQVSVTMPDLCSTFSGTVTINPTCTWVPADSPNVVSDGTVRVCTDLTAGQTARIYHRIGGEMSPFASMDYQPDGANGNKSCVTLDDLGAMEAVEQCMGIRVFSENHVGSVMHYFNCLQMIGAGTGASPSAPIVEGLFSKGTETVDPSFTVKWSSVVENEAAFIMKLRSGEQSYRQTIFSNQPDDSGQHAFTQSLDPATDLGKRWCVSLRTIDSAMKASEWSEEQCATWTAAAPDYLPWPKVAEPREGGGITAFYINEGSYHGRPALLVSGNLTSQLSLFACRDRSCVEDVPDCDGSDICVDRINSGGSLFDEPVWFQGNNVCGLITPQIEPTNFVVYRQSEGRDFVEVSPLIEGISCDTNTRTIIDDVTKEPVEVTMYELWNSFIFLRDLTADAVHVNGVDAQTGTELTPADAAGIRFFYLDRYPISAGETVRYKVVRFDPGSGEPEQVFTSNWLTLP